MQKFINPYRLGELPANPAEFFDREETLAWVESQLIAQRRLLIIHGAPLIGKSSLLKFLPALLGIDNKAVTLPLAPAAENVSDVLAFISRRMMLQLAEQDIAPPTLAAENDPVAVLDDTIAQFAAAAPNQMLLMLIDDFDALLRIPNAIATVLGTLEILLTRHNHLSLILVFQSVSIPFLNHHLLATAPIHQLPPFNQSNALKAITAPVEKILRFDYGVPKRIAELTSNHPYYLNLFCHTLFNRCAREGWVNLRYVDDTLDDVLSQTIAPFETQWQESTWIERTILVAIAAAKGSHGMTTRQEMFAHLSRKDKNADENIISTALESLTYRGVLIKMGALSYRFAVDLFRHWTARHYTLDDILAEVNWLDPGRRPQPIAVQKPEETPADEDAIPEKKRAPLPKLLTGLSALAIVAALALGGILLSERLQPTPTALPNAVATGTGEPVLFTVQTKVAPTPTPIPEPTLTPTPTAPIVVAKSLPSIAYMARKQGGLWQIFVMNTDGSNPHSISDGTGNDTSPVWSPNGRQLAFVSQRDGNREVYVMDIHGQDAQNITNNPADDWTPAWSPDGGQIAFSSNRTGGWEIYTIDADGQNLTQLTDGGSNISPVWSPDGESLVFSSKRDGNWEIYTMQTDGTALRRLTVNNVNDLAPVWSPDGKLIAYETNADGDVEVYVMTTAGGNPRNISQNPYANDHGPVWAPGGQQLLFYSNRDGNWDIYLTDAGGRSTVNITNTADVDEQTPAWRP